MAILLWYLQIRNLHLMLGDLKYYFINHFCFSSRLTGLISMMSLQNPPESTYPHFIRKLWSANCYAFKTLLMHRYKFLGKLADFTLIIFMYLFTVSFETGNIIKLLFFLGRKRSTSSSPTKSTLLTFVIIWPILYGISRRFLMS